MSRLKRAIKCERGLTLIELMITLSLLVILMGVVMTMLFAGTNTYMEQANYGIAKQIGDGALKWLEARLTDADRLRVDSAATTLLSGEEAHYLSLDGSAVTGAGRLYSKPYGEAAFDVFGEAFYFGKLLSIEVTPTGEDSVRLRAAVVEEDGAGGYTAIYANEQTIRLMNYESITGAWARYEAKALVSSTPEFPE